MKWNGADYAEDVKYGFFSMLTNAEKENAKTMKHGEFTELFRKRYKGRIHPFCRGIGSPSILIYCNYDCIDFDFQRELNAFGDRKITMTWSMAARHIRAWVQIADKEKNTKTEEKEMTAAFDLGTMLSTPTVAADSQIKQIPCEMLVPYHNHKFTLYEGERLDDMVQSVKENGVIIPIIVQPTENGKYEILIGHNRWNACQLAGKPTVPAIVKEGLSAETAEMYVVESNLMQRGFDNLKISEQAAVVAERRNQMFSEKKRMEIVEELHNLEIGAERNPMDYEKSDGENLRNPMDYVRTNDKIGGEYGLSMASVTRLIRIDKLIPNLKAHVDSGKLAIRAGVELSFLNDVTQAHIAGLIGDYKIDVKKAGELRHSADESGDLSVSDIIKILVGDVLQKQDKPKSVKISHDTYSRYFDDTAKPDEVAQVIERALEMYFNSETEV